MSEEIGVKPEICNKIDDLVLSERLKRMRERYFGESSKGGSERVTLAAKSLKETDQQHVEIRHAKKLEKILEGIPVVIFDDELTAGSQTRFFRGSYPYMDWDSTYWEKAHKGREVRFGGPAMWGSISGEDYRACGKAASYFKGKTPAELIRETLKALGDNWYQEAMVATQLNPPESAPPIPGVPMWDKLLDKGLGSIIEEAQAKIQRFGETAAEDDPEKFYFWQAVIIVCKAVVNFARRYAQLATEMSLKEEDPVRRRELEAIAQMCEWVPENPARTFHEALQSLRLTHVALHLEAGRKACDLGRMDQYLYAYFKRDIEEGRLTLETAANLVGDFITYMTRLEQILPQKHAEVNQSSMVNHITLGGVTRGGEDATNELTYLFLHVLGLVRYAEPHATLRIHQGTPQWLLLKGLATNSNVNGVPMYVNDEHIIKYFTERGISLEGARDYSLAGCSQPVCEPMTHYFRPVFINTPSALDLALHRGVSPFTGKQIGPDTEDPRSFKTFEEVYDAFKKQHDFIIRRLLRAYRMQNRIQAQVWRQPLLSALNYGCLDKGESHLIGGNGAYPNMIIKDRCTVDVADSLIAMKKLIFDDKKLTMAELLEALDSNFAGERGEEIRQMCLAAPKYGNDIDEADYMARDVAKFSAGIIFSEKNEFGWPYSVNRNGLAWHFMAGKGVGALPNGRKAWEPLNDGSLSPQRGTDKKGPTAILNSALKADHSEALVSILNIKFPSALVRQPGTVEKVATLTRMFIGKGGLHIQFNFVDRQTLLEAKKHREEYRDLIVRVGGYSAYFVDLTPEVQDEIINRTEQML